ncbi:hypothetical protein ODZ84_09890 [Chryseobacterium fluminis]|uniref:hypothetical protein n=1 Tax=Chryseobacterium fluminis TaxID=2983606 RepID=UPI0022509F90|nr:hypothetical protein [Chryseobacterium sp. MMS21-Ot14]UZT99843.1 hypothetical protein ODZ84_09890 [Chryseobacterium sp. MMS21-Ot14]
MDIVESTVLSLNELNESCDETLIETIERDKIAEIIILTGHLMNYNSLDGDIVGEWREW